MNSGLEKYTVVDEAMFLSKQMPGIYDPVKLVISIRNLYFHVGIHQAEILCPQDQGRDRYGEVTGEAISVPQERAFTRKL